MPCSSVRATSLAVTASSPSRPCRSRASAVVCAASTRKAGSGPPGRELRATGPRNVGRRGRWPPVLSEVTRSIVAPGARSAQPPGPVADRGRPAGAHPDGHAPAGSGRRQAVAGTDERDERFWAGMLRAVMTEPEIGAGVGAGTDDTTRRAVDVRRGLATADEDRRVAGFVTALLAGFGVALTMRFAAGFTVLVDAALTIRFAAGFTVLVDAALTIRFAAGFTVLVEAALTTRFAAGFTVVVAAALTARFAAGVAVVVRVALPARFAAGLTVLVEVALTARLAAGFEVALTMRFATGLTVVVDAALTTRFAAGLTVDVAGFATALRTGFAVVVALTIRFAAGLTAVLFGVLFTVTFALVLATGLTAVLFGVLFGVTFAAGFAVVRLMAFLAAVRAVRVPLVERVIVRVVPVAAWAPASSTWAFTALRRTAARPIIAPRRGPQVAGGAGTWPAGAGRREPGLPGV